MARFTITNGPSKWEFILAIFDGDSRARRAVTFVLNDPRRELSEDYGEVVLDDANPPYLTFVINGAERVDGSDDNWHFKGFYPHATGHIFARGTFSTKDRKGWVEWDCDYSNS
ncbi:MAG: hypothetical protein NTW11_01305 [Candidatus Staskawiczbacteria bacterium]|nr:hypothetical protein [Candidatus Staskawiczbacteria bacterium]